MEKKGSSILLAVTGCVIKNLRKYQYVIIKFLEKKEIQVDINPFIDNHKLAGLQIQDGKQAKPNIIYHQSWNCFGVMFLKSDSFKFTGSEPNVFEAWFEYRFFSTE